MEDNELRMDGEFARAQLFSMAFGWDFGLTHGIWGRGYIGTGLEI